jgi:hypothetical protein
LLPLFFAEACFGGAAQAPRAASKLAATQSGSKLPHSKSRRPSVKRPQLPMGEIMDK